MREALEKLELMPIVAVDELNFNANVGRLMPLLMGAVDYDCAYSVAKNCVRVFYATRGQIDGVLLPEDLLRKINLQELAELTEMLEGDWEVGTVD